MHLAEMLVTIFGSVLASSGVWAVVMKMIDRKDAKDKGEDVQTKMLIGLGHDRIMFLGSEYIRRGYITTDEYENLIDYLYSPYEAMGGNGSAKRVIEEVKHLEIKPTGFVPYKENF